MVDANASMFAMKLHCYCGAPWLCLVGGQGLDCEIKVYHDGRVIIFMHKEQARNLSVSGARGDFCNMFFLEPIEEYFFTIRLDFSNSFSYSVLSKLEWLSFSPPTK